MKRPESLSQLLSFAISSRNNCQTLDLIFLKRPEIAKLASSGINPVLYGHLRTYEKDPNCRTNAVIGKQWIRYRSMMDVVKWLVDHGADIEMYPEESFQHLSHPYVNQKLRSIFGAAKLK